MWSSRKKNAHVCLVHVVTPSPRPLLFEKVSTTEQFFWATVYFNSLSDFEYVALLMANDHGNDLNNSPSVSVVEHPRQLRQRFIAPSHCRHFSFLTPALSWNCMPSLTSIFILSGVLCAFVFECVFPIASVRVSIKQHVLGRGR